MINYMILFIPAMLISLFFKFYWKEHITNKESLLSLGANLLTSVLLCAVFLGYGYGKAWDFNVITGYVTGKKQVYVSCEHSYQCNCVRVCSGSGTNQTCTNVCQTCYDHNNDWDWDVFTTIGTFTIDRVDRRGSNEPARWTKAYVGEVVQDTRRFTNWLLVDEESLFVEGKNANKYSHPEYPRPYDYYKLNRVFGNPVTMSTAQVNNLLGEYLKTRGYMNVVMVFTSNPEDYFYSLMYQWKGGKQNDVVMVFGIDNTGMIKWFKSNTYAKGMNNREMIGALEIMTYQQKVSPELLTSMVDYAYNKRVAVDPEQFSFKKDSIRIPIWLILIVLMLNLTTSFFISKYMKENRL